MGKRAGMKKKRISGKHWLLIGAGVVLLAALIVALVLLSGKQEPEPTEPSAGTQVKVEVTDSEEVKLGQGLVVSKIGKYAGIYMEDGSDDPVSDLMMVILKNSSEKDLQLARFSLKFADFTAEFEASNLPAGDSVVLLEQNRHSFVDAKPESAELSTTVFFPEKMSLMEDTFKLTSEDRVITLENISGEDISGDIFVYYKNSASDLLYGGITYRARFSGGLKAGEKTQVLATHYDPDTCRILQITAGG